MQHKVKSHPDTATLGKHRKLMQSRSVANFRPYKIDRRYSDDLDPHIKGATFWDEFDGSLGYYVFDPLLWNDM